MTARHRQSGKPDTVSGVALTAAAARLRVPAASPRPVPGAAPTPQLVPQLTGLADPLNIAAARLDDAAEVPKLGPRGPRVPVHV